MAHQHDHRSSNQRRLALTLCLTVAYMVAEIVGGLVSGSLALLADAGHMLSDAASLALALCAMWLARRPPSPQATFGYHRSEILAALANGVALVVVAVSIVVEAVKRFGDPPAIQGGIMLVVAFGGLLVNLAALGILRGGREQSLNLRGAWLHVLTDALGSVGAMVSGGLVIAFGWGWVDPLTSLIIAALVVYSAGRLLRETIGVLMQNAPHHLDVEEIRRALGATKGVRDVHDLHVWTLTSNRICVSAHVVALPETELAPLLQRLTDELHERFAIDHATIQIEDDVFSRDCDGC